MSVGRRGAEARRRPVSGLLALAVVALLPGVPGAAQSVPSSYQEADRLLQSADTAAALHALRRAVDAYPDFAPAVRDLGAILTARASEVEKDVEDRLEAERHLERAVKLAPGDPAALVAYGQLLWKQNRAVDAERILQRGLRALAHADPPPDPRLLARTHFHLGKVHERWWEDWENLRTRQGLPIADLKHQERDRMLDHFRRALAARPAHEPAAAHLLGHLGALGRWDEYLAEARAFADAAPESYRPWLYLGVGLHELGRDTEASSAFQAAMDRMAEDLRRSFGDVARLLPEKAREAYRDAPEEARTSVERAFFTANDPVFLTEANERELEHLARVAWAELRFSAPRSGLRGWETARGDIWIRYGRPSGRSQTGYGSGPAWGSAGNRQERWSYGPDGPVFAFDRTLTSRRALHSERSAVAAADLEAERPEFYRPRTVTELHEIPLQLARFRGEIPSTVRVEIYARAPVADLGTEPGSRLETGVFVFGPGWDPLWKDRKRVAVAESTLHLSYGFEVARGRYLYGVEARPSGPDSVPRPLARTRGRFDVPGFRQGELSVSDLLLADAIAREPTGGPLRREDLRIEPSRTLEFGRGESVHMYFEVYGLEEGPDGLARYQATLTVERAEEPGVLARVLARIPGLSGSDEGQARVSWERVVDVEGDRAPDFFAFDLPGGEPGRYVASVRIRDLVSREATTVRRELIVVEGR